MANHQKSNGSAPPRLNCAEFFRNPYGLIDDEDSDNTAIGKNKLDAIFLVIFGFYSTL